MTPSWASFFGRFLCRLLRGFLLCRCLFLFRWCRFLSGRCFLGSFLRRLHRSFLGGCLLGWRSRRRSGANGGFLRLALFHFHYFFDDGNGFGFFFLLLFLFVFLVIERIAIGTVSVVIHLIITTVQRVIESRHVSSSGGRAPHRTETARCAE